MRVVTFLDYFEIILIIIFYDLITVVKRVREENSPYTDCVYLKLKEGKDIEDKFNEYLIALKKHLDSTIQGFTWQFKEMHLKTILTQLREYLFKVQEKFMAKNTLMAIVAKNFPPDNITVKKLIQLETKFHEKRYLKLMVYLKLLINMNYEKQCMSNY